MTTTIEDRVAEQRQQVAHALERLRAQRPPLALRAAGGDAGARDELGTIDEAITTAERELALLDDAAGEAQRQAAAAEEDRRVEARAALQRARRQAETARDAAYHQVERALDDLVRQTRTTMDAAAELDRLTLELGERPFTMPSSVIAGALATRILARLSGEAGLRGAVPPRVSPGPLIGGAS